MSEFKDPIYQDYIAHHGVIGMKWGIRRYQNEDGTLTDKGKARFKEVSENPKLQKKQNEAARKIFLRKGNAYVAAGLNGEILKNKQKRKNAKLLYDEGKFLNTQAYSIDDQTLSAGKDFIVSLGNIIFSDEERSNVALQRVYNFEKKISDVVIVGTHNPEVDKLKVAGY